MNINQTYIKYCKLCTITETRPNTEIGLDGICTGCKFFEERINIDWKQRKFELMKIFNKYKNKNNNYYDCIVPSSGGKDSTYQVLKVKEFGMNPLVVTITTDWLTPIGRVNIENLKNQGVDYIEYSLNPIIRKKINKFTLETLGDITWSEEVSVFCSVARIAIKMNIPLIVWGENPGNENGGPEKNSDFFNDIVQKLDDDWFEEFGGTGGLRSSDLLNYWADERITELDLLPYTYPSKSELSKNKTIGIFLGHYIPWDGHLNSIYAKKNGFTSYGKWVEGNIVDYENLDNYMMRIHDYFKFLKYGYDRVSDWSSLAIRRKRISREEGINLTKEFGGKYPSSYLGKSLNEILAYINMTENEFKIICDKFTNKNIFKKNQDGTLLYDNKGDLVKINYDNIK
jgi:N-acetyl sugar amidotransferase